MPDKTTKYKFSPEHGYPFTVYLIGGYWRVAAQTDKSGNRFYYLMKDLTWSKLDLSNDAEAHQTQEEANRAADRFLDKLYKDAVKPLAIDTVRQRYHLKCPSCNLVHVGTMPEVWSDVKPMIHVECPKTNRDIIVYLWTPDGNGRQQSNAPEVHIKRAPRWNCAECYGTGEFVGFSHVDPCSTCFPKPN